MEKFTLPNDVLSLINKLEKHGFEAYAVGGCVRDLSMHKTPHDFDLCTSALPGEIEKTFTHERLVLTGKKHGTITVIKNGKPYEITSFRADGEYSDSRHPSTVNFGVKLIDDLARRDFTINAMAYSPAAGLVDIFGGKADIKAKTLRCVGDAQKRFTEDALRIMRLARFAAQLGFTPESETLKAAINLAGSLKNIAAERINAELKAFILSAHASEALVTFESIFKEILGDFKHDKWVKIAEEIGKAPQQLSIRLAMLAEAAGTQFLSSLKFDNHTKAETEIIYNNLHTEFEPTRAAARRAINKYGAENLKLILEAQSACGVNNKAFENLVNDALLNGDCCTLSQLAVNGADVLEMGIKGHDISDALSSALNAVIDGKVKNERAPLLKMLADYSKK